MHGPGASPRQGVVVEFDDARGLGTIEDATGRRYDFHCTVLEGPRTIAVGTPVLFSVAPGHLGRYEATAVAPAVASYPASSADPPDTST